MTSRPFDPRALDVAAFAAQGGALHGAWMQRDMPRLLSATHEGGSGADNAVDWRAAGERTPPRGSLPQTWLRLTLSTRVVLTCQRCLGALDLAIDAERRFGFVEGEAEAAALDAESEDDVLALERTLDLQSLAEDELLLALPLVPMHDACEAPPVRSEGDEAEVAPEHPFAALAALKRAEH